MNSAADYAELEEVDAKQYNGHLDRAIQRPLITLIGFLGGSSANVSITHCSEASASRYRSQYS